jgi:hypothetical protein
LVSLLACTAADDRLVRAFLGSMMVAMVAVSGASAAGASADGAAPVRTVFADGGPPAGLNLPSPQDVARDPRDGSLVVSDWARNQVLRFSADGTTMSVVAGSGANGTPVGDGGSPLSATLAWPSGLAFTADGTLLIADTMHNRIRAVSPDGTRISTVAGTGAAGSPNGADGDGGAATAAQLNAPYDVVALPGGGMVVADTGDRRVRAVDASGAIRTLAGSGDDDTSNGVGRGAAFRTPLGLAVRANGHVLVVDRAGHAVRDVDPATGATTTVAGVPSHAADPGPGQPAADYAGDDGPALTAHLSALGVVALADGSFLVIDSGNDRVRRVTADGTIHTILGTGRRGRGGDGHDALSTPLDVPTNGLVEPDGDLVLVDWGNKQVVRAALGLPVAPALAAPAPAAVTLGTAPAAAAPATSGPAPVPVAGKTVTAAVTRGSVAVRLPGGRGVVKLAAAPASLPVGSRIDARNGTIALTTATDRRGGTQVGKFWSGRFTVTQAGTRKVMTRITLAGGDFASCRSAGAHATAAAAKARHKPVRQLWGKDSGGQFQTRGRGSVATVRGTRWLTRDTCAGTLTRVTAGTVDVRDTIRHRTHVVHAGHVVLVRIGV